jgi:hypothetical protein
MDAATVLLEHCIATSLEESLTSSIDVIIAPFHAGVDLHEEGLHLDRAGDLLDAERHHDIRCEAIERRGEFERVDIAAQRVNPARVVSRSERVLSIITVLSMAAYQCASS